MSKIDFDDRRTIIEITDFDSKELDIYSRLNEPQLKTISEPDLGLFIAESPNVIERALAAGYEPVSFFMTPEMIKGQAAGIIERSRNAPVYVAPMDVLVKIRGFNLTRGMLCAMRRKELPSFESICEGKRRIVILDTIENPTNIGAIIRSAAALSMDGVVLTRGCCDPLYRRAVRVSMGTVFQIPWTFLSKEISWPFDGMKLLHDMGFATVSMALTDRSVSIDDKKLCSEDKLAIILGNEGEGLLPETLEQSDYTARIPMTKGVDSLNVAAASAVAFWQLR